MVERQILNADAYETLTSSEVSSTSSSQQQQTTDEEISDSNKSLFSFRKLLEKRKYGMISGSSTSDASLSDQVYASSSIIQSLGIDGKLVGHKGCVNSINFNVSGDLIVTGSDDTTVKVWNSWTGKCLTTFGGHVSNVFAVSFLNGNDNMAISGGNDSDIRLYDIEMGVCTIFQHHRKKVLKISCHSALPNCFMTCSADGTIRLFDTRCKYENCKIEKDLRLNPNIVDAYDHDMNIAPQYSGGGRKNAMHTYSKDTTEPSLIVDYNGETLYSVDFNPACSNEFIVSSETSDTRLFDLRKLENHSFKSYSNIYRNLEVTEAPVSGSSFSSNGRQIVHTHLGDKIYTFDTYHNFEKEDGFNYDQEAEDSAATEPPHPSFKRKFHGHVSEDTIKGVSFFGRNSEYVMSGSDDHNIVIWDGQTGQVVRILEGHDDTVNTVVSHPKYPIICSGGIEDFVYIWRPCNEQMVLSEEEVKKRKLDIERVLNSEDQYSSSAFEFMTAFHELLNSGNTNWQRILLRHMGNVIGGGGAGDDDDDEDSDDEYVDNNQQQEEDDSDD